MTINDSRTNQRGRLLHRQRRIAFNVFFCVILAIAIISSCRKEPTADKSTGQQISSAAQTEPQSTQPTTVAQMGPKRPLSKEEQSCQKFAQDFYDWYTAPAKIDKKNPDRNLYMDDVLQYKPQLLDKELYSLIKSDRDCVAKEQGICDLEFDPFFGSQDPSQRYLVKDVHIKDDHCRVPMMEVRDGVLQTTTTVEPDLKRQGNHWVFYNFYYDFSDNMSDNLRGLFKQWDEDHRKQDKKQ
jgi:hypothetical protein